MRYTKEQLIAMSEVEIDKMKVKRWKKLFVTFGMAAALIGAGVVLKENIPMDPNLIQNIGNGIMVANGLTIPINLGKFFKAFFMKSESQKALEEFKNGEIDEESFYEDFVKLGAEYLKVSIDEIEQEAQNRMGRGM